MNKKGMELWQIILIILAVALLLFMLIWYGVMGESISDLFNTFWDRLW